MFENVDTTSPRPLRAPPFHPKTPGRVIRRLEGTERLVAIGNSLYRACFNVVAMMEFEGTTTPALMQKALERVQQENECLQVEVVPEQGALGHWVFRSTDEIARMEVIERTQPDQWQSVWQHFSSNPIDGLAWRTVWLHAEGESVSQLVVTFHHAISDAHSVGLFLDSLLRSLHQLSEGSREIDRPVPMHTSVHRIASAAIPLRGFARVAYHRLFGKLQTIPFDRARVPIQERRWHGPFRSLSPSEVARLHERCRAEGVTISHALSAAMILELADRVRAGSHGSSKPFGVALCTSVDLRRFDDLPVNPRQMGLLVTALHTFYRPQRGHAFWNLTREVAGRLRTSIQNDEHRHFALLPHALGPVTSAWVANMNQGRPADAAILVSNMGRMRDVEYGRFRSLRMFVTGAQAAWGATLLLVAATMRGSMHIHLGHPFPTISDATGAAIADGALERITHHAIRR